MIDNTVTLDGYPHNPWWLVIGSKIYKRVLVADTLSEPDMHLLSQISDELHVFKSDLFLKNTYNSCSDKIDLFNSDAENDRQPFDLILLPVFSADTVVDERKIRPFISRIRSLRLLSSDGILCIAAKNAGTPKYIPQNTALGLKTLLSGGLAKNLEKCCKNNGLTYVRSHVCNFDDIGISEILTDYGYRAIRNSFRINEKLKTLLYSPTLKKLFGEGCITIASANNTLPALCDNVFEEINNCRISYRWNQTQPHVSRIQVRPKKVLISITTSEQGEGDRIAILTIGETAKSQRMNEYSVISEISTYSRIKKLLPKAFLQKPVDKTHCFVIEDMPGITIDYDNKNLGNVTNSAYNALARITEEKYIIKESNIYIYKTLAGQYFTIAKKRFYTLSNELNVIQSKLFKHLSNMILPIVIMHGDYKIENIMFLTKSTEISGIIDWELSDSNGLPLLDLLFLITYNELIITNNDFLKVFESLCEKRFSNTECQQIVLYKRKYLADDEVLTSVLYVLFYIHHFSCRFELDINASDNYLRVSKSLHLLNKLLDVDK